MTLHRSLDGRMGPTANGFSPTTRAARVSCTQSLPSTEFIAMPPNPALNRTGRYTASFLLASARPAG
jgi:hypothetical protein